MQIQTICENIGNSGCLCFCDLYLAGINPAELISNYNKLVNSRIIQEDCYINDHELFLRFFGISKNYIISNTQPVDIPYIANYKYKNKNHFVVEQNGRIIFNSLDDSNCVNYGKKEQKYRYLK